MLDPQVIPRFELRDIANAIPAELDTLRKQIERGQLRYTGDHVGEEAIGAGRGRPRLYSATRAFHIALSYEIARFGIPISEASRLALQFSDLGGEPESGKEPAGEIVPEDTEAAAPIEKIRLGGRLFREGTTGLVIRSSEEGLAAQVVKLEKFQAAQPAHFPRSYLLVNCSILQVEFFQRLGFDWEASQ